MAMPLKAIVEPAIACENRSSFPSGSSLNPYEDTTTIAIIVEIVVRPKTAVTAITPVASCWEAGYISIGINGSQGPSTKTVNSTHGVIFAFCPSGCS